MKKIISVVGARPNFMKIAPIIEELNKKLIKNMLIHTGQHYSANMSDSFFRDLRIPEPNINLNVGSLSRAGQIASIMQQLEKIFIDEKPALVIVVGDVNSTIAAALTASSLKIKVAHVEAGLRSFDMDMPEESNRILTDHISDFLFCTEQSGIDNLKREGIEQKKIFLVGNVMIDTMSKNLNIAKNSKILEKLSIKSDYCILTAHRPENVDTEPKLRSLVEIIGKVQELVKVVYPVHPRTIKMMQQFHLYDKFKRMGNVVVCEPLGYLDFIWLVKNSKFVITDSGGLQEESTYLGVPCLTIRRNTERPVTVEHGTNIITGLDKDKVITEIQKIMKGKQKNGSKIKLWDGKAAKRIVGVLIDKLK